MSALTVEHAKPEDYERIHYALITPDGRMFNAVSFGGHSALAYKLSQLAILPEGAGYDNCVHVSFGDFDFARDDKNYCRVTQAQFNTMFDYKMAIQGSFPWDRLEVI